MSIPHKIKEPRGKIQTKNESREAVNQHNNNEKTFATTKEHQLFSIETDKAGDIPIYPFHNEISIQKEQEEKKIGSFCTNA